MAAVVSAQPQQINLFNPSLLPAREPFSSGHLVTWIIVAAIGMIAVGWWAMSETRLLRQELAETARTAPPPINVHAISPQQVAALDQALVAKQALLDARTEARDAMTRGMSSNNGGPSAVMRIVADSIPQAAWLAELKVQGGRLDLTGKTVDAGAVDAWLERLRAAGFLAAAPPPTVKVERIEAPAGSRLPQTYVFQVSATLALPFADEAGRP